MHIEPSNYHTTMQAGRTPTLAQLLGIAAGCCLLACSQPATNDASQACSTAVCEATTDDGGATSSTETATAPSGSDSDPSVGTTSANDETSGGTSDLPPTTLPALPPLPDLDLWEQHMLDSGQQIGQWQQGLTNQDSFYYDAAYVFLQIQEYTGDFSTGPGTWQSYIDNAIEVTRDNYVLPNNGIIQAWRVFPHGLYAHWQATDDAVSQSAIEMLRANGGTQYPLANLYPECEQNGVQCYSHQIFARSMAYQLQAHVYAEKAGFDRQEDELTAYVGVLENHLRQWTYSNYNQPEIECRPWADDSCGCANANFMNPFMVGIAGYALIEFYEAEVAAGRDPNAMWPKDTWQTIPDALRDMFVYMFEEAVVVTGDTPDKAVGERLWIADYEGTGYGTFRYLDRTLCASGGPSAAPVLNLLIAPTYAWLGTHFSEERLITEMGDAVWQGGVRLGDITSVSANLGKRFGQNYQKSFHYVLWRDQYGQGE